VPPRLSLLLLRLVPHSGFPLCAALGAFLHLPMSTDTAIEVCPHPGNAFRFLCLSLTLCLLSRATRLLSPRQTVTSKLSPISEKSDVKKMQLSQRNLSKTRRSEGHPSKYNAISPLIRTSSAGRAGFRYGTFTCTKSEQN
jgi:hypothetical protein